MGDTVTANQSTEFGVLGSDSGSVSSAESSFADETSEGYMDDSTRHGFPTNVEDEEKPMIGKKISNTFCWKLFVIALMFVNTTVVIAATSIFLNNEADKEFDRAVRKKRPVFSSVCCCSLKKLSTLNPQQEGLCGASTSDGQIN